MTVKILLAWISALVLALVFFTGCNQSSAAWSFEEDFEDPDGWIFYTDDPPDNGMHFPTATGSISSGVLELYSRQDLFCLKSEAKWILDEGGNELTGDKFEITLSGLDYYYSPVGGTTFYIKKGIYRIAVSVYEASKATVEIEIKGEDISIDVIEGEFVGDVFFDETEDNAGVDYITFRVEPCGADNYHSSSFVLDNFLIEGY